MILLAGSVSYILVTHNREANVLGFTAVLGAFVLVASIIQIRRDPWSYLQLLAVVILTVAIFAGVFWWNLKTPVLGQVTAIAAPLGLGLGIWSVLGKKPGR